MSLPELTVPEMRIGVAHVADRETPHVALAAKLVASVRRTMPGVPVVHLTDALTAPLAGVDGVLRSDIDASRVALAVLDLYAEAHQQPGPWVFVDSDVLFHAPVEHVFREPFDLAVASRDGTLKPCELGTRFMARMPYNKGVVFSRSRAFWQDAAAKLRTMKLAKQQWMGDQQAMNDVIAEWRYRVRVLDSRYNYAPHAANEPLDGVFASHWKGLRKAWLMERAA